MRADAGCPACSCFGLFRLRPRRILTPRLLQHRLILPQIRRTGIPIPQVKVERRLFFAPVKWLYRVLGGPWEKGVFGVVLFGFGGLGDREIHALGFVIYD